MPILTGVITSETVSSGTVKTDLTAWPVLSTVSAATLKQLHTELAAVGLPVLGAEATGTPQFGSETEDRIRAFQKLHGLPATGAVDPTTGGVMVLAAMVTTESDPGKLRAGLRAAQDQVPNSPQYNYMLARSAILAGDYDLAVKVRPNASDVGLSAGGVLDIPTASPQAPEVPFPENFYTCRYEFMSQDLIVELRTNAPAQVTARLAGQPDVAGAGGEPSAADDQARQTVVALRPRKTLTVTHPVSQGARSATSDASRSTSESLADSARAFLDAVEAWQLGNAEFANQRYASAVAAYDACQQATLAYFALFPDYQSKLSLTAPTLSGRMDELVFGLASNTTFWSDVWTHINFRRQLLSLVELGQLDWIPITRLHAIFQLLEGNLAGKPNPLPPTNPLPSNARKALMDARLVIIAAVLVPLARAEANRLRRQYAAALEDLTRSLRRDIPVPNSNPPSQSRRCWPANSSNTRLPGCSPPRPCSTKPRPSTRLDRVSMTSRTLPRRPQPSPESSPSPMI